MICAALRTLAQQVRDAVLFAFTPHAAADAFWGEATQRCRDGARELADAEAEFEVWPSSENRLLRPLNLEDIADRLDLLSGQVEDVLKLLKPGGRGPVPPLFTLPDRGHGSPGLPVYPEANGSNIKPGGDS